MIEQKVKAICKRCNYSWEYEGRRTYWATCPSCKTSVKIKMFVELAKQEENKLKIEINRLNNELDLYHEQKLEILEFMKTKNPLLFEEWKERNIKKIEEESNNIIKEVFEHGKSEN